MVQKLTPKPEIIGSDIEDPHKSFCKASQSLVRLHGCMSLPLIHPVSFINCDLNLLWLREIDGMNPEAQGAPSHWSAKVCTINYLATNEVSDCVNERVRDVEDYFVLTQLTRGAMDSTRVFPFVRCQVLLYNSQWSRVDKAEGLT